MQATVRTFDPSTRSGSVLLDDGVELPYDAAAFAAGGMRLLRVGQRVRIEVAAAADDSGDADNFGAPGSPVAPDIGADPEPRVTFLTVATMRDPR